MSNVVDIGGVTTLPIDPSKVLTGAPDDLKEVLVIGHDKNGEFYFAVSDPNRPKILWLLENARAAILKG